MAAAVDHEAVVGHHEVVVAPEWRFAPEWWCIEGRRWRIAQCCFPDAVDVAAEYFER